MTDDIAAAVESPYEALSFEEKMGLLVETEMLLSELDQTKRALRASILEEIGRDKPMTFIANDPGSELGYGVTATRVRGAHRWKYNPKAVMRRLKERDEVEMFTNTSLDTKLFNQVLTNNEDFHAYFDDIVSSKYDNDKLMVKGLTDLLKARGL